MKRSCAKHLVSALSLSPQKFQHNMFFFQPFGFACCIFSTLPSLMYGKDLCLGKITGTGLCFPREGSNGCTSLLCCGKGSVTLRSRELIKFHSQCGEEECRTEAHSTGQQSTAQYCKKPCDNAQHSKAQYNRVERHSEMHNKSKHNARTVQTPWHNRAQHGMTRHSAMQFKTIKEMLRIPHPNLLRWHGASENVLVLVKCIIPEGQFVPLPAVNHIQQQQHHNTQTKTMTSIKNIRKIICNLRNRWHLV